MSGASRTANQASIRFAARKSGLYANFAGVFATERGGPFTPDAVNRLIKRIGERAGFDFPLHGLRVEQRDVP
jgi:hypothetical protein